MKERRDIRRTHVASSARRFVGHRRRENQSNTACARTDMLEAGYVCDPIRARATPPNQPQRPPSKDAPKFAVCMRHRIDCRADDAAKRARRESLPAALPVRLKSGL